MPVVGSHRRNPMGSAASTSLELPWHVGVRPHWVAVGFMVGVVATAAMVIVNHLRGAASIGKIYWDVARS